MDASAVTSAAESYRERVRQLREATDSSTVLDHLDHLVHQVEEQVRPKMNHSAVI